jgi:hypothetical protein
MEPITTLPSEEAAREKQKPYSSSDEELRMRYGQVCASFKALLLSLVRLSLSVVVIAFGIPAVYAGRTLTWARQTAVSLRNAAWVSAKNFVVGMWAALLNLFFSLVVIPADLLLLRVTGRPHVLEEYWTRMTRWKDQQVQAAKQRKDDLLAQKDDIINSAMAKREQLVKQAQQKTEELRHRRDELVGQTLKKTDEVLKKVSETRGIVRDRADATVRTLQENLQLKRREFAEMKGHVSSASYDVIRLTYVFFTTTTLLLLALLKYPLTKVGVVGKDGRILGIPQAARVIS